MNMTLHRGFTLIELMIVVAIVAILGAVVYPSYQSAVVKSKRADGWATLTQIMQHQERYYSQNNTYIDFSKASPKTGFKWYSGDSASASSYEIKAEACTGDVIVNCVKLTAMAGTSNVNRNFKDSKCGDLSLDSTGQKSVSVSGAKDCW